VDQCAFEDGQFTAVLVIRLGGLPAWDAAASRSGR
jgi:hypothetical protein